MNLIHGEDTVAQGGVQRAVGVDGHAFEHDGNIAEAEIAAELFGLFQRTGDSDDSGDGRAALDAADAEGAQERIDVEARDVESGAGGIVAGELGLGGEVERRGIEMRRQVRDECMVLGVRVEIDEAVEFAGEAQVFQMRAGLQGRILQSAAAANLKVHDAADGVLRVLQFADMAELEAGAPQVQADRFGGDVVAGGAGDAASIHGEDEMAGAEVFALESQLAGEEVIRFAVDGPAAENEMAGAVDVADGAGSLRVQLEGARDGVAFTGQGDPLREVGVADLDGGLEGGRVGEEIFGSFAAAANLAGDLDGGFALNQRAGEMEREPAL